MQLYPVNRKFWLFLLNHWLKVPEMPGQIFDESSITLLLDNMIKLAQKDIAPCNRSGDNVGVVFEPPQVKVPPSYHGAYQAIRESGVIDLGVSMKYGGLEAPMSLDLAVAALLSGANTALMLFHELTVGVIRLIDTFATEEMKSTYIPRLIKGEWNGTMVITEPQAGSYVGGIATMAVKEGDHYLLKGNKSFISWAESDLHENTIHMVLGRTEGAPQGTAGLSLFLVPRILVNPDGTLGKRNDIAVTSIEEKMGNHGSPTCGLSFGDNGCCIAYLVGEENKGMEKMRQMMDHARVFVGAQSVGLSHVATLRSQEYCEERVQFKKQINKFPAVQERIVNCKVFSEGMTALLLFTGSCFDRSRHEGPVWRLIGKLLTPLCKAYITDITSDLLKKALLNLGGYGYSKEYGFEQYIRDQLVEPIYEGTNDIQYGELLRIMSSTGGESFTSLFKMISCFTESPHDDMFVNYVDDYLRKAVRMCHEAAAKFVAVSGSQDSLKRQLPQLHAAGFGHMLGHTVVSWLLFSLADEAAAELRKRNFSEEQLDGYDLNSDEIFYWNIVQEAIWFAGNVLPAVQTLYEPIGRENVAALKVRI